MLDQKGAASRLRGGRRSCDAGRPSAQYNDVKAFFDKVKAGDDQPALLKVGANVASSN